MLDANTASTRDIYFLGNLIETTDGDFIINISAGNNNPIRKFITASYLLRIDRTGVVKWSKQLLSDDVEITYFGSYYFKSLKQLPGGNIVVGSLYDDFDSHANTLTKVGCHFIEMDYGTGEKIWDKSYKLNDGLSKSASEIKSIALLDNGDLSFLTHCLRGNTTDKSLAPVNIITDSQGNLKSATAYFKSNSKADCRIENVVDKNGTQFILMEENEDKTAILAAIDEKGKFLWQKSYKGVNEPISSLSPALHLLDNKIYFASTKATDKQFSLYKVDTTENLACMASLVALESQNVTSSFTIDQTNISTTNFYAGQLRKTDITSTNIVLTAETDCSFSDCCKDVVDTAASYTLCEGNSIHIAKFGFAKQTGIYYSTTTKADGCDSISLYKVLVIKNPATLKLPADTCLTKGDQIVLQASPGFEKYKWSNNPMTNSSDYAISLPGKYWVTVTNTCGTNTMILLLLITIVSIPFLCPMLLHPTEIISTIFSEFQPKTSTSCFL